MTTITITASDETGALAAYTKGTVTLVSDSRNVAHITGGGEMIVGPGAFRLDADGTVDLTLTPTSDLTPEGCYYEVRLGTGHRWWITVPDSGTYEIGADAIQVLPEDQVPPGLYPSSGGGGPTVVTAVCTTPVSDAGLTWLNGTLSMFGATGATIVIGTVADTEGTVDRGVYTFDGTECILTRSLDPDLAIGELFQASNQIDTERQRFSPAAGLWMVIANDGAQPILVALNRHAEEMIASDGPGVTDGSLTFFGPARTERVDVILTADIESFAAPDGGESFAGLVPTDTGYPVSVVHCYTQDETGGWEIVTDAETAGTAMVLWATTAPDLASLTAGQVTAVRYTQVIGPTVVDGVTTAPPTYLGEILAEAFVPPTP